MNMRTGLNAFDFVLIGAYLLGITLFGLRFRRRHGTLRDYFLAGRSVPWWAIALSIVAAETSTLTIISIPGLAYDTNLNFLQLVLGYLVGRVLISVLLIPHFFRGEVFTAYQIIDSRFGQRLRLLTAGLFLFIRAAAEGVRVFAVSIVVGIAIGPFTPALSHFQRDLLAITIVTVLTLLYTFEGGLTAVIWTDVIQLAIYIGATLLGLGVMLRIIPGGWQGVQEMAGAAGKFAVFNFSTDVTTPYTFWAGIVGGTFLTMASHGTDQLMVQRLLAAKNQRASVAALLASGVAVLAQFTLFLLVGLVLFVLYKGADPVALFGSSDRIFPTFIVRVLPHGVSGLLIAAILAAAMSNLSAALNSLSSTTVMDFYALWRPASTQGERLRLSRLMTLAWALVLFALAMLSRHSGRVVEVGLSIAAVAYGGLLGVFLLGTMTKRCTERGAMAGMVCGILLNLHCWLWPLPGWALRAATAIAGRPLSGSKLAWTWYVAVGSATVFLSGLLFSEMERSCMERSRRS